MDTVVILTPAARALWSADHPGHEWDCTWDPAKPGQVPSLFIAGDDWPRFAQWVTTHGLAVYAVLDDADPRLAAVGVSPPRAPLWRRVWAGLTR